MAKYCMLLVEVDYPKFFMLKITKMRLKKIKNQLAAAEMNAVEGGVAYGGAPIQKPLRDEWPWRVQLREIRTTLLNYIVPTDQDDYRTEPTCVGQA